MVLSLSRSRKGKDRERQRGFMEMKRETGGDGGFMEMEWQTGGTVPLAKKCLGASEFRRGRKSSLLTAFRSHDLPGD